MFRDEVMDHSQLYLSICEMWRGIRQHPYSGTGELSLGNIINIHVVKEFELHWWKNWMAGNALNLEISSLLHPTVGERNSVSWREVLDC